MESPVKTAMGCLEILENVIDHLYDEKQSLTSCGAVCKAWLSLSRYHLFYSIDLSFIYYAQGLVRVLNDPLTTIPPFVRRLYIRIPNSDNLRQGSDAILPCLGSHLLDVRHLTVANLTWSKLGSKAKYTLLSSFQRVISLKVLDARFPDIEAFGDWICSYRQLERLSIRSLRFDKHNRLVSTKNLSDAFTHIDVTDVPMRAIVPAFFGGHWLYNMQSVYLEGSCTRDDVLANTLLLRDLGAQLQHLYIRMTPLFQEPDTVNLVHNTELRSLSLGNIYYINTDPMHCSILILRFLAQISSPHMELIEFTIPGSRRDLSLVFEWDRLEAALDDEKFEHLRCVRFVIDRHHSRPNTKEFIRAQLPSVNARGMIEIESY